MFDNLFIIQASPRSGSHMLGLALRQHPDISYFDELLNSFAMGHLANLPAIDVLNKAELQCKTARWGFTLHNDVGVLHSLKHRDIWPLLIDKSVIKLRRNNKLEQAVSLARASRTRQWLSTPKRNKPKAQPLSYDEVVNAYCRLVYCEQHFERYVALNNVLNVSYEDLVHDWQPTVNKVLDFLGLKQMDLQSVTTKTGHPVAEQVDIHTLKDTVLDGVIV